jgi:hypothetical protein
LRQLKALAGDEEWRTDCETNPISPYFQFARPQTGSGRLGARFAKVCEQHLRPGSQLLESGILEPRAGRVTTGIFSIYKLEILVADERFGMRSSDKWEHLAEILRAIEPALERKLDYCRANPPDPVKQPVTSAVVTAYVFRVELELATIRGGVRRLKDQLRDRPGLTNEILEIESWILRRRSGVARPKLTAQDEQALGDWFVSKMGFSYSETRQRLAEMQRSVSGKGAPNKKIETLKLLDARICNGWSYQELARRMCDCGSSQHADYCADRIRKRVGELVAFLKNYGIEYSRPAK